MHVQYVYVECQWFPFLSGWVATQKWVARVLSASGLARTRVGGGHGKMLV